MARGPWEDFATPANSGTAAAEQPPWTDFAATIPPPQPSEWLRQLRSDAGVKPVEPAGPRVGPDPNDPEAQTPPEFFFLPQITLPRIEHHADDSVMMRAGKSIVNVGNEFISGMSTPALLAAPLAALTAGAPEQLQSQIERIQAADNTPPYSAERMEAALSTVALLGGAAAGARESTKAKAGPVAAGPVRTQIVERQLQPHEVIEVVQPPEPGPPAAAAPPALPAPATPEVQPAPPVPAAPELFQADTRIPFMAKIRMEDQLRAAGHSDEAIAGMTSPEASQILDEIRRQQDEAAAAAETERQAAAQPPAEQTPIPDVQAPRADRQPLSEEDIARRQYEDELRQQMGDAGADQGHELLEAVIKAGGLAEKGSDGRQHWGGELDQLEEMARDPKRTGERLPLRELFRKDAPRPDDLTTSLRGRGFDVQTPEDVRALLDERIRSGRPLYGNPALTEELQRVGVMEGPGEFGVAPNHIPEYVRANGIADTDTEAAAEGIAKIFDAARGASNERYIQPELFSEARRPGAAAVLPTVSENVRKALRLEDRGAAAESFKKSDVISSILPKVISREIPGFNIKGKIIRTPQDFALLNQALRTPYMESIKVAFLDKNDVVVHSQILHVGSVNQSIVGARDFVKAFQDAKQKGKAVSMIQAHNHPSGDPEPSFEDRQVFKKLDKMASDVGLKVLDHIITNGDSYYSAQHDWVLPFKEIQPLAPWEVIPRDHLKKIDSVQSFQEMAKFFRQINPDVTHVFYGNTRTGLTAVERVPLRVDLKKAVLNGVAREGAYGVWIDMAPNADPQLSLAVRHTLENANVRIFDIGTDATPSMREVGMVNSVPEPKSWTQIIAENNERPRVHAMGSSAPHRGGGTTPPAPGPAPTSPAIAKAVAPLQTWWQQRTLGIRKLVAPQTIDTRARMVANIIRDYNGQLANTIAMADHALAAARSDFDRTPVPRDWKYDPNRPLPRNYAFIDNSEHGGAVLSPQDRQLKAQLDKMFTEAVDEVHRVKPKALQDLIQNYFPHIWEDPEQAKRVFAQIMSGRPLEGPKGFLKQRVIEYTLDGLKAGLRPISDNPIDLSLTKLHEVHRFVAAQDMLTEAKAIGARKFVYIFEKPPEGWRKVDDPTSTVHGPPFVTVPEAFDEQMRVKTIELLNKLGVSHERLASLGSAKRWGDAAGTHIRTKFAGPLSVYWHELGHVLQHQYGWIEEIAPLRPKKPGHVGLVVERQRDNFGGKSEIEEQFRKLADLRMPAGGSTPSFKSYIRNKDEKAAVMLEAYIHAPERMRDVAPNIYGRVKKFIAARPELHGIEEIKPNVALGSAHQRIDVGGMVTLGNYYMPEGAAQVFTNYLSPGLQRFGIIRNIRTSTNILSGLQLGFSAFHAGFTSIDAAVSQFALALRYASEGKMIKAAAKVATTPAAPITNYLLGRKVQRAMLEPGYGTPEIQNIAQLAVRAGLRATVDPFWKTQITRNMMRAWHDGGVKGYAGTVLRAPFALSEQMMRPILEYLVPRQKLGVFAGMAEAHMQRLGPNAEIHAVRDAMARAADATEDRMGQMTYDNLFYNRVIRDAALLGFRAYGWTYGKYRALFGSVADVLQTPGRVRAGGPVLSDRMLYPVALVMVASSVGSIMNYWMTGQPPQDWKDALMPRTGRLDRHGNPQRLSLPTYIKDILSDWHDFPNPKKMLVSLSHKLNPWLSVASDVINNADFFGTKVYDEASSFVHQQLQKFVFVMKSAQPFAVTGAARLAESDPSLMQQVLPFFGFVPAKAELSMTPAQLRAAELMYDMLPRGARSQDKAEHSKLVSELTRDAKEQDPEFQKRFAAALATGQMQPPDITRMFQALPFNPFQYQVKRLSAEDSMKVWDLATPPEREQIRAIILLKLGGSKTITPEQRVRFYRLIAQ